MKCKLYSIRALCVTLTRVSYSWLGCTYTCTQCERQKQLKICGGKTPPTMMTCICVVSFAAARAGVTQRSPPLPSTPARAAAKETISFPFSFPELRSSWPAPRIESSVGKVSKVRLMCTVQYMYPYITYLPSGRYVMYGDIYCTVHIRRTLLTLLRRLDCLKRLDSLVCLNTVQYMSPYITYLPRALAGSNLTVRDSRTSDRSAQSRIFFKMADQAKSLTRGVESWNGHSRFKRHHIERKEVRGFEAICACHFTVKCLKYTTKFLR